MAYVISLNSWVIYYQTSAVNNISFIANV